MRILVAWMLAGCASVELAPPRVRERSLPAQPIARVVALPATCGTLTAGECAPLVVEAADALVRSELAFRGLHVIDSESLNAATASRREITVRTETERTDGASTSRSADATTTIARTGPHFEDVSPIEQREILRELGAHGLLTTRIFIGAPLGMSDRRTIHVQVRLLAAGDFALVWSRRCDLEVAGLFTTDTVAIERGTRCAVGAR